MVAITLRSNSNDRESAMTDVEAGPQYQGEGTDDKPYIVEFRPNDGLNPKEFSDTKKWFIVAIIAIPILAVTMTSSAYSSSALAIERDLHASSELFAAGIALYVLGFAVGPALWAPLSELYGRYGFYVGTLGIMTAFTGGTAGSPNIASVLVFRFLTGTFGASPLTNSGGIIADMFSLKTIGLPMIIFGLAPLLGPMLGPIIGGFVTDSIGWRWLQGICCIFLGIVWIAGALFLPETYGPIILQREAKRLSRKTGKRYISVLDNQQSTATAAQVFRKAIIRPWVLLFAEPIVLVSAVYLSILYATIYMFLPAFPIVYQEYRGWSAGIGGLSYLGVVVGMLLGLAYMITDEFKRYRCLGNKATPESRLPPVIVGAIAIPIGLFGFAWTNAPSVHWSVSIILSSFFGFGVAPVFVLVLTYLLESYTIYAASVLAATAMLRAFIGAAFPLFTSYMFRNLGLHWASSIPAFLTVLCLPFPFVMYKYGPQIRMKCKYAAEAAKIAARMAGGAQRASQNPDKEEVRSEEGRISEQNAPEMEKT